MEIRYLTCPNCGYEFYITTEFAGRGYDWFCPRCSHVFKEGASPGAVTGGQSSPSGPAV